MVSHTDHIIVWQLLWCGNVNDHFTILISLVCTQQLSLRKRLSILFTAIFGNFLALLNVLCLPGWRCLNKKVAHFYCELQQIVFLARLWSADLCSCCSSWMYTAEFNKMQFSIQKLSWQMSCSSRRPLLLSAENRELSRRLEKHSWVSAVTLLLNNSLITVKTLIGNEWSLIR